MLFATLAILVVVAIPYAQAVCPGPVSTTYDERVCEWKRFEPSCPGGVITINSVFYGRLELFSAEPKCDMETCLGTPSSGACPGGFDLFTCNSGFSGLRTAIDAQCNNVAGSCSFEVNNSNMGGDPCVGTYKYATINWTCTV